MRRQGLVARRIKRRNGLTRQDKTAPKFPDLLKRNVTADRANARWVGDMTEIPTAGGKLYLATVIDLYSRRLLGAATGLHPDAELACSTIKMAVAARGGVDAINQPGWRTDEAKRVVFRQCRCGGVLQQPGVGGPLRARVREHPPGPGRRPGLVLRVLQP
jgi:transposase InsO family protein